MVVAQLPDKCTDTLLIGKNNFVIARIMRNDAELDKMGMKKMDKYTGKLFTKKNAFLDAIPMQIAAHVDKNKMGMWRVFSTLFLLLIFGLQASEKFLRERLDPAKQIELGDSCLKDTRVNILKEATDWLEDPNSQNILWIVGAPGTGKSTIATTLAKKLECPKFFCNHDVPELRDPRRIWRTLAYSLAERDLYNGVKAALMKRLSRKNTARRVPQVNSVIEQFQQLFKWPLETDLNEKFQFKLQGIAFPVVIIDALDECEFTNVDCRKSLLESLTCWSTLPGVFRLIVTSRNFSDIHMALDAVSHHINLTTGDDVSDDSKNDIRVFFTKKFEWMRKKHPSLPSDWPSGEDMQELTAFAAGQFIWADMVVSYITLPTADDPVARLRIVLDDAKNQSGIDGCNQVDHLYARIIFDAFRCSTYDGRNKAKTILATILLAKEPLRESDLVALLSTDTWNPAIMIESTLRELSPIISVTNTNDQLRVCHKTVSDFLLSEIRSLPALGSVVEEVELPIRRTSQSLTLIHSS